MVVAAVGGYEADCKLHARSNTLGIFVNPGCIVGVVFFFFLRAWLFKTFVVLENTFFLVRKLLSTEGKKYFSTSPAV